MSCLTKPCKSCPFSRKVTPGELGGSSPFVYVGQIQGPFILNCHSGPGYEDPKKRGELGMTQCAGAAIFRANLGLSQKMPKVFHSLPENHELVFSSFAEFLAHHIEVSVSTVETGFRFAPPEAFLEMEMEKVRPHMVRVVPKG